MKKTSSVINTLILCLPLMLAGCSGGSDDTVANQITAIERYLESTNVEYTNQDGVYRLIGNMDRPGYNRAAEIAVGDQVYFYIANYQFSSSRIEPAFYSNRDFIIDQLIELGLDDDHWTREPIEIRLGKSGLLKGISKGLPGCREGDSVRMFLTSKQAYGENYISNLPLNSAIECVLWIDKVIK